MSPELASEESLAANDGARVETDLAPDTADEEKPEDSSRKKVKSAPSLNRRVLRFPRKWF